MELSELCLHFFNSLLVFLLSCVSLFRGLLFIFIFSIDIDINVPYVLISKV